MVKLVDTLVSGTSDRKVVQVRVLFWAPQRDQIILKALKSNDLGAFVFSENIKGPHENTRLKRQNRDTCVEPYYSNLQRKPIVEFHHKHIIGFQVIDASKTVQNRVIITVGVA